jgi:small subunit ribosomal protein S17
MKIFTGKVKSTKMQKTAVVETVRIIAHPRYKKRMKRTKKYLVHDQIGVKPGQTVRFVACKPVSKMKKWKILEIVSEEKKDEKKSDESKKNNKK